MYSSFIAATQTGDRNASATVLGSIGEDEEAKGAAGLGLGKGAAGLDLGKGDAGLDLDKGAAGLRLDKKEDELLGVVAEKQVESWEDLDLVSMRCVLSGAGLGKIGIVNDIGGGVLENEGEE
ncbi:hypothetical protein U1Q18_039247 [Sarracenia purpurea var. burkii]